MKQEDKKYILDNVDKKTIKEIAKELHLTERKVKRIMDHEGIQAKRRFHIPKFIEKSDGGFKESIFKKAGKRKFSEVVIFMAIVVIAFIIRLIYLNEIKANPFFVPAFNGLDDYLYNSWAQEIAGGNFLGKEIFYGLPLYPYFLGLVYLVFGYSVFTARVVQFLIGSFSCGLIYLIGTKVFNRTVGLISGLMLSFYAMSIFLEGFFVSVFLAIFLNCLVILLLLSVYEKPHFIKWITIGFLIGLSALASASIFIFVPFLIVWGIRTFKNISIRNNIIYLVFVIVAMILVIAPVTIRNYIVSRQFVPITAHSGITFFAGNNSLSDGTFQLPKDVGTSVVDSKKNAALVAERVMQKALTPKEVSDFWFYQSLMFMKEKPLSYIQLLLKKIVLFWNANEIPDILPLFFFKRYSMLLRMPLFSFSIICPLALFGIFLCFKFRRPEVELLYFYILSVFLSTVIYFVNSRYRLVSVPFLIIFASVAIYWLYLKISSRGFRTLIFPAISMGVIFLVIHIQLLDFRPSQAYNNLGIILKRKGLIDEAIQEYKKAIESDANYSSPHFNIGILYIEKQEYDQAINSFNNAIRINPFFPKAYKKLGQAYYNKGDRVKALSNWRKSLEQDPNQDDVRQFIVKYSKN